MTTLKLKLNPGLRGPANTLTVGTVTTGDAGTDAVVTISGDAPDQTIDFTIPRGAPGGDLGFIPVQQGTGIGQTSNTVKIGWSGTYLKATVNVSSDIDLGNILVGSNNLSDVSSASTVRTNLGLVIGTNVQAFNARLSDLAGISWAQGDIIYYDGTNLVKLVAGTNGHFLKTQGAAANPVWAAAPGAGGATLGDGDYGDIVVSSSGTVMSIDSGVLTAAGRALIDDADAAAQRTTLGLGTANNPQFATIELGHASDTTISRSSAGIIAVESVTVPLNSTTNTHTAQQIELGHASDTTLSRSSAGVIAVEGVTVPLNSTTNIHTAQQIELGHASDTTITRVSAGVAAVEGKNIALNGTSEVLTTGTIELGNASDTTLSRSAAGILAVEGVDQARVAGNQNLTGGFTGTSYAGGTVTGSNQTYTPSCANVNVQHITLNGSSLTGTFTFAVPTVTGGDCGNAIVEVVNGGSGSVGATLSASGYTRADTAAYNTTNGNKFLFHCLKTKNYSRLLIEALQ